MKKFIFLILVFYIFSSHHGLNATIVFENIKIKSPNGKIIMTVNSLGGALTYRVNFRNKAVIEQSSLGFKTNFKEIGKNAEPGKKEIYKVDETYPWRGVHSLAKNQCNGVKISITENNTPWTLEVKVFNDGIAFRYLFGVQRNDSVIADKTTFVIPTGSIVWSQNNIKSYEGKYKSQLIDSIKCGEIAGPPITIHQSIKI